MIATRTCLVLAEESLRLGSSYPRVSFNLGDGASGVSLVAKAPRWLLRLASGPLKLALLPLSVCFHKRSDCLSYRVQLGLLDVLQGDLRLDQPLNLRGGALECLLGQVL
jgi:hypothetical protein